MGFSQYMAIREQLLNSVPVEFRKHILLASPIKDDCDLTASIMDVIVRSLNDALAEYTERIKREAVEEIHIDIQA